MDNFSVSSNIAAQTNISVLQFLAEDASFFLSNKKDSNDLRNDFVCVMEMDLMELSLQTCVDSCNLISTPPKFELTLSNNVLHIRTCSDSFKALSELITYYASFGDLEIENVETDALASQNEFAENENGADVIPDNGQLTKIVQDAMKEVNNDEENGIADEKITTESLSGIDEGEETAQEKGVDHTLPLELHFTPTKDEQIDCAKSRCTPIYPQLSIYGEPVMEANGIIDIHPSDEDDEDFFILENDPGVGILPSANGEAEARVLTDEPIVLKENHFSPPSGKLDLLQAPKHFPSPVNKYLIHDISVVWHMYGGEDFGCDKKVEDRGSIET